MARRETKMANDATASTAYRQRVGQEQKYIKIRGDVGPQLLAFDDARRGVVSGNLYVGLRWYEQVFYEKVS